MNWWNGTSGGRTRNLPVDSRMLCQLSHGPCGVTRRRRDEAADAPSSGSRVSPLLVHHAAPADGEPRSCGVADTACFQTIGCQTAVFITQAECRTPRLRVAQAGRVEPLRFDVGRTLRRNASTIELCTSVATSIEAPMSLRPRPAVLHDLHVLLGGPSVRRELRTTILQLRHTTLIFRGVPLAACRARTRSTPGDGRTPALGSLVRASAQCAIGVRADARQHQVRMVRESENFVIPKRQIAPPMIA